MRRRQGHVQWVTVLPAVLALSLAGCSSAIYDPSKRIPGVTKSSEFPPIQVGVFYKKAEDNEIHRFTPTERVEFHSDDGRSLFLYSWTVVKAGPYGPLWEADQLFTFERGVYQNASEWLTVVPTDGTLVELATVDTVRGKLGREVLQASRMRTGRTGIEANASFYLFRLSGGYLLVQADAQGRIVGTRQDMQGLSPWRALQQPSGSTRIQFWKALQESAR